ncbi:hypothetical protein JXB37_05135 [candidate division WOR-3 bacterium]|nr:hypothetical protein [candidate division WOR-3 bacterium]
MLETIAALFVVGLAVAALVLLLVFVLRMRATPVQGHPEPGAGALSDEELERLLDEGRDE